MIRKNKKILIGKAISLVFVLLTVAVLLVGCQGKIPETQKHNYAETPYSDYSLTGIPKFVDDVASCVDTEKQYVLPDGYIYEYQSYFIYSATNQLTIATDEGNSSTLSQ